MDNDILTRAAVAAASGMRVDVDLNEHCLAIEGDLLVSHGHWQGELGVDQVGHNAALAMIERAYADYECSVPAHDGRDRSRWFYATDEDRLTDAQLALGEERPRARCRLEVLTLALIVNGSLTSDSPQMRGRWFWQSKAHPRLVILTQWLRSL